MDNTVKSAVFFCFKESTHYPRYLVGEPVANVQGFIPKAIGVISHHMIVLLSDRLSKAVFFNDFWENTNEKEKFYFIYGVNGFFF